MEASKEQIALKYGLCNCDEAYTKRGLTAPDCPWHAFAIEEAMEEYAELRIKEAQQGVWVGDNPKKDGFYAVKYVGGGYGGCGFINGNWNQSITDSKIIAYLDESATSNYSALKERAEKVQQWDSERMVGRVKDRFKELEEKNHEWRSFYNGWLEGRYDMLAQNKGLGIYKEEKEVKP